METGTLGTRRPLNLDALTTEAAATVSVAADKLNQLAALLRRAYEQAVAEASQRPQLGPAAADLARGRALLGRIELAERGVREAATTIERDADEQRSAPPAPDQRMAILAAQEQERARLANELHDGPAQTLANLIFQAEIVERAIRSDAVAAQRELDSLRQMVQGELGTLRAYINQLRPPLIAAEDLNEALREAAQRLTEHDGIQVELRLDAPPGELDEPARAAVLRIAQEALRNISKHAGASHAWLATRLADDGEAADWQLEVGDDGRGFDLQAVNGTANRRHFGLRFMRERSELLGATLSFETRPSAGTVVRLAIATRGKGRSE